MEDERYYHYERRWLNKKHGRAFSISSVGFDEFKETDKHPYAHDYITVNLQIGDCHEDVNLDFSFDVKNEGDYKKQIEKIDAFIESLKQLKTSMKNVRPHAISNLKKFEEWSAKQKNK